MFGAVTACLYEYILGIRHDGLDAGYSRVVINPASIEGLGAAEGYITTPKGRIEVSYKTEGTKKTYTVVIPADTKARILIDGAPEIEAGEGIHVFTI